MRTKSGKILSIVLVLCMVFALFPSNALTNVRAADTDDTETETTETDTTEEESADEDDSTVVKDAFGIDISSNETVLPEGTNPLGSDEGWTVLYELSELSVSFSDTSGSDNAVYDYTPEDDENSWGGKLSYYSDGTKTGSTNSSSYYILDTTGVNAGNGNKEYTAYLGYSKKSKQLELSLFDANGSVSSSNTLTFGETGELDYLSSADGFYKSAFLSVAAGDFNGDGKDSIIVYVPVQQAYKSSMTDYVDPYIVECTIETSDNGQPTLKKGDKIVDDVYTKLTPQEESAAGNGYDDEERIKITPTIDMAVGDTDRDGVDELVITANLNRGFGRSDSASCMNLYDCLSTGWSRTYQMEASSNEDEGGIGTFSGYDRLRAAGSDVGNVILGNGVDYPEIVTAGHLASGSNNVDGYLGSVVTVCDGCTGSGMDSVGKYESKVVDLANNPGMFTYRGFRSSDSAWVPTEVTAGSVYGLKEADVVLISDTVYSYNTDESVFKREYCNSTLKMGSDITAGFRKGTITDVAAGNFNGNEDGSEQFFVSALYKMTMTDVYSYYIYTYYYDSKNEKWTSAREEIYYERGGGNEAISICSVDVDNDSTIGRLIDTETSWSEPEVYAVLEAAPYYSELGVSGETVYGTSQYSSVSQGYSDSVSSTVTVGYEASFLGFGAGVEAEVESKMTWETSATESMEYSVDYTNDSGENAVVIARRQGTNYIYELYDSDATISMLVQGDLATSLVTVDDYNEIVAQYDNLYPISESELATAGDPFSYRASTFGLEEVVKSAYNASSSGVGTQTQSIDMSQEEEDTYEYEMNFTFKTWATAGGAKAGVGAGAGATTTSTTVTGNGTGQSGTVSGTYTDGYSFNWQLIRWMMKVSSNGGKVPAVGYILDSVMGLPSPPVNLSVEASSITQNSATLVWENAGGNRSCETYYIYQVYADGSTVRIGEIDGTEEHYDLADLDPDTSYSYAISAYNSSGTSKGESVLSDVVVVTTLPDGESSVEVTDPVDASAKIGGSATFKADITVSSSHFRSENQQWQKKSVGGSWTDISGETTKTLTLSDLQMSDDGTQVRCVFRVAYSNASSAITYYSNPATLTVGETPVDVTLTVSGWDSGEGEYVDPYTGLSDYRKPNTKEEEVTYITDMVFTAVIDGTEVNLTLRYATENGEEVYYGYDADNNIYYRLTPNGDGTYTVGAKVTVSSIKYVISDVEENEIMTIQDIEDLITLDGEEDETYYLVAALTDTENDGGDEGSISKYTYTFYWCAVDEDTYTYTYYENDNGTVGNKVENLSEDTLYDVHFIGYEDETDETSTINTLLLGQNIIKETTETDEEDGEEYTVTTEEYNYYLLTLAEDETSGQGDDTQGGVQGEETGQGTTEEPGEGTTDPSEETVDPTYTLQPVSVAISSEPGEGELDPSTLTTKTVEETKKVTTTSYENVAGTTLTLTANVVDKEDDTPAVGATVDFQITNLATLSTETVTATVEENGLATATWTASTDGLYSIQVVVRKDGTYALTQSDKQYYEAGATYTEDTTEYRLELLQNGKSVDGAINYGDSVDLSLLTRAVTAKAADDDTYTITYGDWGGADTESITYSYIITGGEQEEIIENPESFKPETAGSYTFYAYINGTDEEDSDPVALAALNVNPLAITITPTWSGDYPIDKSEVTLKPDIALVESPADTDAYLKGILDIYSDYFDLEDKTSASGQYMIYLGYISDGTDDDLDTMNDFRTNYLVTLQSDSFNVKKGSARIDFSCGVDGTIAGRYAGNEDNNYVLASGSSRTEGTALSFVATPNSGYSVYYWTINGTKYMVDDQLPAGMHFDSDGKRLVVESLDLKNHVDSNSVLTVYVEFISTPYKITYDVDEDANGTLSAVTADDLTVNSDSYVAKGTDVILTAEPDDGYAVAYWTVNNEVYTWDDTSEEYRGTTLTLSNINGDEEIRVYFKEIDVGPYSVTVEIYDEDGKEAAYLADVTAENKLTGEAVDLPASVAGDTSLTFSATTYQSTNPVSKWEISKDGGETYSTFAGPNDDNTASVYNIEEDTIVRLVLDRTQKASLNYEVQLGDETVTDPDIGEITAATRGYALENGESYEIHIPVDFTLTIGEPYYLIGWDTNVKNSDKYFEADGMSATLSELLEDTTVVATIADKPVVNIPETEGGTITVTGTRNGVEDVELQNGDYFDPNTELTVTLTPNPGYVVSYPDAAYTDGTGSTTDEMTYVISDVDKDLSITDSFTELAQVTIEYCVESESEDDLGGSLSAYAGRKGIKEYEVPELLSGDAVYAGSDVTFVAKPDEGRRVKQWTVNGEVYVDEDGVTVDANTLELDDVTDDMVVTVLFEEEEIVVGETTVNTGTTTKILQLRGTAKKSSASLKWNKVKNADGYKIYQAKCGKKMKLVKTIKNGSKNTLKVKKLKKGTCYKFVVKAYKTVNGKDVIQKTSNVAHVATTGGKFTNVKKVKLDKSLKSVKLKVGKTKKLPAKKIKTKTTLVNSKKKLRNHANVIYFRTTDSSVATVGKKSGKIKAQGKGTCQIYVYAADGQYAKVKVTVK